MKDLFGLHKFLDWRGRTLSSRWQANTESTLRLRIPPSEKANHSNPDHSGRKPVKIRIISARAQFEMSFLLSLRTFYESFIRSFRDCVSNSHETEEKPRTKSGAREIKGMWIHEVAPERLAEIFHHYHQALTPEISGKGSEARGAWQEVPQQEKSRLVAAARLALLELESMNRDRAQSRQYFAQPGEAEWGC
ncbi:MAG: hypothetical protein ABSD86_24175 [Candidatus Sulfotelmatobacter sp.]|jgi:hypothetical protein